MKVWTHNDFTGYQPTGTAAVVVANTAEDAATLLSAELDRMKLPQHIRAIDFRETNTRKVGVVVLCNGDY